MFILDSTETNSTTTNATTTATATIIIDDLDTSYEPTTTGNDLYGKVTLIKQKCEILFLYESPISTFENKTNSLILSYIFL